MARPRKKPEEKLGDAFTVRLNPGLTHRVEKIRMRFQEQTPFAKVTTADVLRYLIEASATATEIGVVEIEGSPKAGGKKAKD